MPPRTALPVAPATAARRRGRSRSAARATSPRPARARQGAAPALPSSSADSDQILGDASPDQPPALRRRTTIAGPFSEEQLAVIESLITAKTEALESRYRKNLILVTEELDEVAMQHRISAITPPRINNASVLENIRYTNVKQLRATVLQLKAAKGVFSQITAMPSPPTLVSHQGEIVAGIINDIRCLGQTVASAVIASRRHGGLEEQLQYCNNLIEMAHAAVERQDSDNDDVTSMAANIDLATLFVVIPSARVAADAAAEDQRKADTKADTKAVAEKKVENTWRNPSWRPKGQ